MMDPKLDWQNFYDDLCEFRNILQSATGDKIKFERRTICFRDVHLVLAQYLTHSLEAMAMSECCTERGHIMLTYFTGKIGTEEYRKDVIETLNILINMAKARKQAT